MIQLTCIQCKRQLSIDDGFAGGVCRCQFCGTIQTVPQQVPNAETALSAALASKSLGGSKKNPPSNSTAETDAKQSEGRRMFPVLLVTCAAVGVVCALIGWFFLR